MKHLFLLWSADLLQIHKELNQPSRWKQVHLTGFSQGLWAVNTHYSPTSISYPSSFHLKAGIRLTARRDKGQLFSWIHYFNPKFVCGNPKRSAGVQLSCLRAILNPTRQVKGCPCIELFPLGYQEKFPGSVARVKGLLSPFCFEFWSPPSTSVFGSSRCHPTRVGVWGFQASSVNLSLQLFLTPGPPICG